MSDNKRTTTLAEMKRIVATLNDAKGQAARAQGVMDDCAQRILSGINDMDRWSYYTFREAAETAQRVRGNLLYVASVIPTAVKVYGDAMETAQRAATGMVIESEGSANDLPYQAIAAAATAQLSWAEASGNAISAQNTVQEALRVSAPKVLDELKLVRSQMIASDRANGEGMAATARVEQCVREYEQII